MSNPSSKGTVSIVLSNLSTVGVVCVILSNPNIRGFQRNFKLTVIKGTSNAVTKKRGLKVV